MKISEFTNNDLLKEQELIKRKIKDLMSEQKQIDEERAKRFDEGKLTNETNLEQL